jgi:hypothetical protein
MRPKRIYLHNTVNFPAIVSREIIFARMMVNRMYENIFCQHFEIAIFKKKYPPRADFMELKICKCTLYIRNSKHNTCVIGKKVTPPQHLLFFSFSCKNVLIADFLIEIVLLSIL